MSEYRHLVDELVEAFLAGDKEKSTRRTTTLLSEGMSPIAFFQQVFTPAMSIIGERFGRLDIFLPELMTAADTAKEVVAQTIVPALKEAGAGYDLNRGRVVIGSVRGDLHTIGKNMVTLMLEVNGFEVIDLGVNIAGREFVDRAVESGADIVGLSSLMTTSMPYMREVVELRDGLGHHEAFSIIIGGAPITAEYSREIGADAFGSDAVDAVQKCNELMQKRAS
jgi:trimethylamine corrinoid protein